MISARHILSFLAALPLSIAAMASVPVSDIPEPVNGSDSVQVIVDKSFALNADGDMTILGADTIPVATPYNSFEHYNDWEERDVTFNPDPTRAVWLSALFPGLGQIYNRRYWKLPIVVGGFMGLGYATSWNNTMLNDYQRAYRDIMDDDPTTKSYMDFFPPTTSESSIDKTWLTNLLKSRKDFYRRNRDLCLICMAGVYLLAMLDAYVDASLSHFDISPDLSMDLTPSLIPDMRTRYPGIGLSWAINF